MYKPQLRDVQKARQRINGVVEHTPLMHNVALSELFSASVLLKREDLQCVRSYKIRGAYNKIASLSKEQ
ncbi:MAG: threonine dehydratase, partial [Prevotellaceae bacterium]|nr:threonine dehydratase [Prevotellaceae bacterium]